MNEDAILHVMNDCIEREDFKTLQQCKLLQSQGLTYYLPKNQFIFELKATVAVIEQVRPSTVISSCKQDDRFLKALKHSRDELNSSEETFQLQLLPSIDFGIITCHICL